MKSIEINSKSVRQRPRLSRAALLNEINRNETHTHTARCVHTALSLCVHTSVYTNSGQNLYIQVHDSFCIYKLRTHIVYKSSGLNLYIHTQDSYCIYKFRTQSVYTNSGLRLYIKFQDSYFIYKLKALPV